MGLAQYLAPLTLWVVTAIYLASAYQYAPDSRAFPAMVGWAMLLLVSLDLAARTPTPTGRALLRWLNPAAEPDPVLHAAYPVRRQIAAMAWVAGFAAALVLIGVLAAVPLFVFASMRLRGGRPVVMSLAAAGGAVLFIWLLFSVLLRLPLYPGLLVSGL
ncbi:MAG TPA: tripartite tricarboxylate transporter TctB family protein [Alphaproteobacteria bacterium]